MKVAISTIIDYNNYGNRLQNYATAQVLKQLGYSSTTLPRVENYSFRGKIYLSILKELSKLNEIIPLVQTPKANQYIREIRFERFTKRFIPMPIKSVSKYEVLKELGNDYDFILTGSDQVWNYNFRSNLDIDFLRFVPKKKRIAYSPSFGVSEIPLSYQQKYKKYLNEMEYLSVREEAGNQIIKQLTGRESEVLIDPTMMLEKDEWLQIASRPKCTPNKKYLLTYVLGNQTKEFQQFVNRVAQEKELEILNLLNPNNRDIHSVDPGEFIYLINHAEAMITDSFHGAVFSILMQTPFVIFEREDHEVSMNSRIDTLVNKFNMETRRSRYIKTVDEVVQLDFSFVESILKTERQKSLNYLQKALLIK